MKEYPEPVWNAENKNRKQGDTTFKTCGWCKFVGSGSCRYDCHLEAHCDLMKSYDNDVKWDTSCKILNLSLVDVQSIVRSKEYDIKESKRHIERRNLEIKTLLTDKRIPRKKKPALPGSRDAEYFKLKDVVWVFHENKWNRGMVVPGYRTYDGCVSYVLDNYPNSAKGWGCGMAVPCILLDWEYTYFKKNLTEFKEYLKMCDRVYNGERLPMDNYYNAMTKGGVR